MHKVYFSWSYPILITSSYLPEENISLSNLLETKRWSQRRSLASTGWFGVGVERGYKFYFVKYALFESVNRVVVFLLLIIFGVYSNVWYDVYDYSNLCVIVLRWWEWRKKLNIEKITFIKLEKKIFNLCSCLCVCLHLDIYVYD